MLTESGVLSGASQDLRDLLTRASRAVTLADGETLFAQGDTGDALYAVTRGAIELSVLSREGRKLSLDVLHPGAVFGEIALFDPGMRTASAAAIGETELLRVRNGDLLRELHTTPDLAVDLIGIAGRRMRWMAQQLSDHVFLPMPSRLARKILHLTAHQGETDKTLQMSQSDLAEFVGATREAVSKTLNAWKAEGVIENARGGLRVRDIAALRDMARLDEYAI